MSVDLIVVFVAAIAAVASIRAMLDAAECRRILEMQQRDDVLKTQSKIGARG